MSYINFIILLTIALTSIRYIGLGVLWNNRKYSIAAIDVGAVISPIAEHISIAAVGVFCFGVICMEVNR